MPNKILLLPLLLIVATVSPAVDKPKLTLDEFFDSVDIADLQLSPDGHSLVFKTERADWNQNIYRDDLWLYHDDGTGTPTQLTQSGHDSAPQWSPDGRWIAFLSERKTANDPGDESADGGHAALSDLAHRGRSLPRDRRR